MSVKVIPGKKKRLLEWNDIVSDKQDAATSAFKIGFMMVNLIKAYYYCY